MELLMLATVLIALTLMVGPVHSDSKASWHQPPYLRAWHQACWNPEGPKVVAAFAEYEHSSPRWIREDRREVREVLQPVTDIVEREGPHTIRWKCNEDTQKPVVHYVRMSRSGFGVDYDVRHSMQQAGHDDAERIYLVFTPGYTKWCGSADMGPQDEALYAHVECWSPAVALHEFLHTLGAVPFDAPNQAQGNHCDTLNDVMCRGYGSRKVCPHKPEYHIDCGRDDYYMHDGDWLDVADSPFLRRQR